MPMKIIVGGNAPADFKEKLLARLARDVAKPVYTIKSDPEPDSPCVNVFKDGALCSSFTSLYAAKCWIEHVQGHPQ